MDTKAETELLELETGALAAGGGCVARAPDGRVVFVRHSLPGERVRARVTGEAKAYLRADAVEVLRAAPERVRPRCPHAGPGRCGGCDFQHVALPAQRRLKAALVEEQLRRLGGIAHEVVVESVPGDDDGLAWRTRVRLAVDRQGTVAFRRHRSHRLEPVENCPIASPSVTATGIFGASWPGVSELEIVSGTSHDGDEGEDGHGTTRPEPGPPEAFVQVSPRGRGTPRLPEFEGGLVVRNDVRRPPGAVHAVAGGHTYRISAGVFWQVHPGAGDALLQAVLAQSGECAGLHVVDLYAGAGLFAVALADAARGAGSVLAIERDRRACADARHNARVAGVSNLRILAADVTPALVTALKRPAVVVLDPAREGAGTAVMGALASHAATLRRLVYVSCDAASFARDARVLLERRWRLSSLRAFDIFPMTEHVELVAAFDPPAA